jgi:hypothetical protein
LSHRWARLPRDSRVWPSSKLSIWESANEQCASRD